MVTKNQINLIRQIKRKRNRREKKLFIVEGKKSIDEFLSSNYKLHEIYSTHPHEFNLDSIVNISTSELSKLSSLKKPNKLQDGTNYSSVRITHIGNCSEKKIKDIKTQFFDRKMKDGDFTKLNLIKTETTIDSFWADAKTIGKVNTAIMDKACRIRLQNIINPKDGDPPAFSLDLLKKTKP